MLESLEKITFKKVLPEDWGKFKEIRLKGLLGDPQAFGGTFEEESQENKIYWKNKLIDIKRCFYTAEKDNIFIAIAGSIKITDDNWMIVAVYTVPEFRGKGISQKLINMIIDKAKKSGVNKLSLTVNINQINAVNLYKKLGFKITEEKKDQKIGDNLLYDEYSMEKNL